MQQTLHQYSPSPSLQNDLKECPHCSKAFSDNNSLVSHCRMAHDQTIDVSTTKQCLYCGSEFQTPPSHSDRRKYCSIQCSSTARSETARIALECEYCGGEFKTIPSKSDQKYCSVECQAEGLSGPRERIKIDCQQCGAQFEVRPSNTGRKFCSRGCSNSAKNNKIELSCGVCGESFKVSPSRRDAKYCSDECYGIAKRTRIEKECSACGGMFKSYPSKNRKYCSTECAGVSENKVILQCDECGDSFDVVKAREKTAKYCSRGCQSEALTGEGSPRWKGGNDDYGPSWSRQRRKAVKRDNEQCCLCNIDQEGHRDLTGESLHVHHIVPFRKYGLENHEEANRLDNLITVCRSCHHQLEPLSQKREPEVAP